MTQRLSILIILTIVLAAIPTVLHAQEAQDSTRRKGVWSGNITAVGGSNFENPLLDQAPSLFSKGLGDLAASIKYTRPKFSIGFNVGDKLNYDLNSTVGYTFKGESEEEGTLSSDLTLNKSLTNTFNGGVNATFTPSGHNSFTAFISVKNASSEPEKIVITTNEVDIQDTTLSGLKFNYTDEEINKGVTTLNYGGSWTHVFNNINRKLVLSLDSKSVIESKETVWEKGNTEKSSEEAQITEKYRETPVYSEYYGLLKSTYSDSKFLDVKDLNVNFMLNVRFQRNIDDLSAATWQDEKWVDSLSFKEKFDFVTITADPTVSASYKKGKFQFSGKYTPQFYAYKLSSDIYFGTMSTSRIMHLANISSTWDINDRNALRLSFNRDIKRPTYLNLCWFRRSGDYANEFYEGNQDLNPEIVTKADIEYRFRYKSFSATVGFTFKNQFDKIEKVFNNVDIEGESCRIYTWINAGYNYNYNPQLSLEWNGKKFYALFSYDLNRYHGVSNNGDVTEDVDFRLKGTLKYMIKTWEFKVWANYQSEIKRSYSKLSDYVGLNARIDKKFKKFSMYIEGNELFDNAVESYTYSEDMTECRGERTDKNRRIFLLGFSWSF